MLRSDGAALVLRGAASDYLVLTGSLLFVAAHAYAHRKAARPAGPASDA
ncbi:hypothetical protein [Streptomyces sp. NPDC047525]